MARVLLRTRDGVEADFYARFTHRCIDYKAVSSGDGRGDVDAILGRVIQHFSLASLAAPSLHLPRVQCAQFLWDQSTKKQVLINYADGDGLSICELSPDYRVCYRG